jgi:hypothetical protein
VSDPRLEELWAEREIRRLALRYALAVDFRDRDLLLSLWAEADEPARSPDINIHTVRSEADRWLRKEATVHVVANHLVDLVSEEEGIGSVYCWAQLHLGEEFVDQAILYRDRYVLRDGRWLFLVRRHLLWYGQARSENPMLQPEATWPRGYAGRGSLPGDGSGR